MYNIIKKEKIHAFSERDKGVTKMFGKYKKLYNEEVKHVIELDETVYNLNLYLYWLEKNFPDIFEDAMTYFDGMAGYVGDKRITNIPEDFVFND